jgi:hypothetical protein
MFIGRLAPVIRQNEQMARVRIQMHLARMMFLLPLPLLLLYPISVNAADQGTPASEDAGGGSNPKKASRLRLGNDDAYVQVYGQINKGVLLYNDGVATEDYWIVDNDNSSTRAGITGHYAPDAIWSFDANVEAQWNPYSTSYVNQTNKGDVNFPSTLLRKAEIQITNANFGKVWLGQGSMASDNTSEIDLSGTAVVGYASVADMAGGQLFRYGSGTLSPVSVGTVFSDLDGLGRKLRARYDTPRYRGFGIGASVGTEVVTSSGNPTVGDVALTYAGDHGDFKIGAGAAVSWPGSSATRINGSLSLLHNPTGISLTVAGAYEDRTGRTPNFQYLKIGYQTRFWDFGVTAFSVDGYLGGDINAAGTNSRSIGFQLVQNIDSVNAELYAGIRTYKYGAAGLNYDDGLGFLAGMRKKF